LSDPDPANNSGSDWILIHTTALQTLLCPFQEAGLLEFFWLGEGQLWIDLTLAQQNKEELTGLYQLATSFIL